MSHVPVPGRYTARSARPSPLKSPRVVPPDCVTVNTRPATVNVPVRGWPDGLPDTRYDTVPLPVPQGVEAYCFKLTIDHAKTIGADACAGCLEGVCVVLNEIKLNENQPWERVITNPLSRNYVTWQGGIPDCPGATPVRNTTWGRVKSLYR